MMVGWCFIQFPKGFNLFFFPQLDLVVSLSLEFTGWFAAKSSDATDWGPHYMVKADGSDGAVTRWHFFLRWKTSCLKGRVTGDKLFYWLSVQVILLGCASTPTIFLDVNHTQNQRSMITFPVGVPCQRTSRSLHDAHFLVGCNCIGSEIEHQHTPTLKSICEHYVPSGSKCGTRCGCSIFWICVRTVFLEYSRKKAVTCRTSLRYSGTIRVLQLQYFFNMWEVE